MLADAGFERGGVALMTKLGTVLALALGRAHGFLADWWPARCTHGAL
jgi:hypothetical protein